MSKNAKAILCRIYCIHCRKWIDVKEVKYKPIGVINAPTKMIFVCSRCDGRRFELHGENEDVEVLETNLETKKEA